MAWGILLLLFPSRRTVGYTVTAAEGERGRREAERRIEEEYGRKAT